jgi:prolipoprotein diacylglyceryltransferase
VDLYCAKRFALEFLRGDAIRVIGLVSWVHVYTVAGMVAATALMLWNLHRSARTRPQS